MPRVRDLKLYLPAFVPKSGAVQSLKMLGPFNGSGSKLTKKGEGIGYLVYKLLPIFGHMLHYLLVPELEITLVASIGTGMIQLKAIVAKYFLHTWEN